METPSGVAVQTGSFRDPSGFVFTRDKTLYRQVNLSYRQNYDRLIESGLYHALVREHLLIPHEPGPADAAVTDECYRILLPVRIPFISYPYEWCLSQLKHAALATLQIQRSALRFGMSLKDASAYNIQFWDGQPILIDTLSFEEYREGQPWVAYGQFCRHFLAPLVLMARVDIRLQQLLRSYIDGIPLNLASRLLSTRSYANWGTLLHIHLHARAQERFGDRAVADSKRTMTKTAMLGLIDSLFSTIEKLSWNPRGTGWSDYYSVSNYTGEALEEKKRIVTTLLQQLRPVPESVWDLGANRALFSRIASQRGIRTIAFDLDPTVTEENYLDVRASGESTLLPLCMDLTNPSPDLGWENTERTSLLARGPADLVFALALVHHFAIANNVPFSKIAAFLHQAGRSLLIEFVPKEDSQVQKLLRHRTDIFPHYDQTSFERAFSRFFSISHREEIAGTHRTLYLMSSRSD